MKLTLLTVHSALSFTSELMLQDSWLANMWDRSPLRARQSLFLDLVQNLRMKVISSMIWLNVHAPQLTVPHILGGIASMPSNMEVMLGSVKGKFATTLSWSSVRGSFSLMTG